MYEKSGIPTYSRERLTYSLGPETRWKYGRPWRSLSVASPYITFLLGFGLPDRWRNFPPDYGHAAKTECFEI